MSQSFKYGIETLTASMALAVASGEVKGILSDEAVALVQKSHSAVKEIVEKNKTV